MAPTADPGTIVAGLPANAPGTSRGCGDRYIAYEPTPLTPAERDRVYRRVHALLFRGEADGGGQPGQPGAQTADLIYER